MGEMKGVMQEQFGDKARFLLCRQGARSPWLCITLASGTTLGRWAAWGTRRSGEELPARLPAALPSLLPCKLPPCSEVPQPSIRDVFGLGSLLPGGGGEAAAGGGEGGASGMLERLAAAGGGEEACYAAARAVVEAAMDEAEQRALWAQFRVQ